MVYDPRAPRRSNILIQASSLALLSIFEILQVVSSRKSLSTMARFSLVTPR